MRDYSQVGESRWKRQGYPSDAITAPSGDGYCWLAEDFCGYLGSHCRCPRLYGALQLRSVDFFEDLIVDSTQTFGFATEEFEVTAERLGVYLPVVSASRVIVTSFRSSRCACYLGTH